LVSSDLIRHGLTMPRLVFTGVALVLAGIVSGLIASGWRWASLLGAVLYVLQLLASSSTVRAALSHPSDAYLFAFNVVFLALAAVGMAAGIGATVQNYRRAAADRPAPRWLAAGLAGLAGVVLGAILVAALAGASTDTGASPQTLATLPGFAAQRSQFAPTALSAHVGQPVVLRLDNRDDTPHTFTIHELNVDIFMPAGKSALALFAPTKTGAFTITCDFHPAMYATLTVSP
jgi:heme/copper-type cytochrome/quinol oxidase subunit 2